MFLGHIGIAFAAKRVAPKVSLGVLVAAATWIDLIWPLFVLAGVERVELRPGDTAMTPLAFVDYPYTHSLLAVLGWSVLAAVLYALVRRGGGWRGPLTVGALVTSHWVLDLLTHRPDLPLWPGGPLVGLGLWNSPAIALLLELAIFAGGVALYLWSTHPLDRVGRLSLAALVTLLVAIYLVNMVGPPPPSAEAVVGAALAAWLFVPWAAWIDLHRASTVLPPPTAVTGG